jgi:DNA ligase-associated metallophosphoesterase
MRQEEILDNNMEQIREIMCGGEVVVLSSQRGLYWPERKMLVLADLHLGKAAYFQKNGIQVSSDVMTDDLKRLTSLIDQFRPDSLLVAGDMFHHHVNGDFKQFSKWRERIGSVRICLVPGNHDRLEEADLNRLEIEIRSHEYRLDPFLFTHEMGNPRQGLFTISGHIHPGFRLEGRSRQAFRLPCYVVTESYLIMPAFSHFTGLSTKYPRVGNERIFVTTGNAILEC